MGKRFRRRIGYWLRATEQEMIERVPAVRRIGVWAIVFVLFVGAITLLAQQYATNLITSFAAFLWNVIGNIITLAGNHLGVTAIILLCAEIGILTFHAYIETRPPHNLDIGRIVELEVGTYKDTGFEVINNTGADLLNCRIYISEIDEKKRNRETGRDYLYWGVRPNQQQKNTIDIPNTEIASLYIKQTGYKVKSILGSAFAGNHEFVLVFNADSIDGRKTTMYIYCMVLAEIIEKTENTEEMPKITLLKAEK